MRLWEYIEPTSGEDHTPVTVRVTDYGILKPGGYFSYWLGKMLEKYEAYQLLEFHANKPGGLQEMCIQDFTDGHWAREQFNG